eukprot:CAMPEP_0116155194 /NCGR_PEP_ID=MMETSP0329-20121206/22179_1 /TAXON_ID=697910 /ORGANISM="Pseudo-nitzschia arenysensis, Strain B593" /LENGTH=266 /DNA_ID=CAMNT_0003652215 /DNA_START=206 /DNA_END=1007 /DNA_ORIENTATION=-
MAFRRRPILFASDPETPIQETTESSSKTSETETTSTKNNDAPSLPDIDLPFDVSGLAFKVALGLVAAFATYELATIAIATTTEFLTTLSSSFQNNFWGFLASLPENLWNLAVGIFGFLKVFLPAVGEFGKSAYDVAAPIVSETSQKAMEVAAPVLQDTAEKVAPLLEEASRTANEAAAPYVDQLQTAVESSIVAPIQDAKGRNAGSRNDEAVSGAVEAQVSSATKAVGDAVDAQIQGTSKAVETQIQSASKNVGDALDAQFKKFFP